MALYKLDRNSASVRYLAKKDLRIAYLISKLDDLSYETWDDGYLFIIHEIIEQMLSIKAGNKIFDRLLKLCNGNISPQIINTLDVEYIRTIGTSLSKSKCIKEFTQKVINQEIIIEDLPFLSNDKIIAKLTSIKGIGVWTSKMYLIFVLDRQNILPYEDIAFIQGFKWLYQTNKISKIDIEKKQKDGASIQQLPLDFYTTH